MIGKLATVVRWPLIVVTAVAIFLQLYMVFNYAPTEKYMGNVQRLMYFHVPSAIVSLTGFGIVFVASLLYLMTKNKLCDQLAYASGEISVLFTVLEIITGSLWARPVWNAWWVWDDPRLVTALILLFIYIAYLMLHASVQGDDRRRKVSAIFAIIGFVDVPLVYFSVRWWRTIHPIVMDSQGFHMPELMAATLSVGMIAFLLLFFTLLWHRTAIEILKDDIRSFKRKGF